MRIVTPAQVLVQQHAQNVLAASIYRIAAVLDVILPVSVQLVHHQILLFA